MLWVDKHRPLSLDDLDFQVDQAQQLKKLATANDLPHMLFYGPSGAGKKTRVLALLRAIFGPGVEKVKLEHRTFTTPTGKSVEIASVSSNHHIEINPGDAGIYDRFVVQDVIKEMAEYGPVVDTGKPFKIVLLSEVDGLSTEAQAALRRTMEKYSSSCRLIMIATNHSKVIEPVRSRCIGVRVSAPTQSEIIKILTKAASHEGITVPPPVAAKISAQSNRNLRRALLMLESAAAAGPLSNTTPIPMMDWEKYCVLLANDIITDPSPKGLLTCRAKIYDLVVNCIPADVIIKKVVACLIEKLPPSSQNEALKHEFGALAAHYEHKIHIGSKDTFHLEAFCAKIMATIKTTLVTQEITHKGVLQV